jgi:hypothetical protein
MGNGPGAHEECLTITWGIVTAPRRFFILGRGSDASGSLRHRGQLQHLVARDSNEEASEEQLIQAAASPYRSAGPRGRPAGPAECAALRGRRSVAALTAENRSVRPIVSMSGTDRHLCRRVGVPLIARAVDGERHDGGRSRLRRQE